MTEILPGIYRIILKSDEKFTGSDSSNAFLIKGSPRSLLIDCGFDNEECLNKLSSLLSSLQISFDSLDLFLTHRHHDHAGLCVRLSSLGVRIFMNPLEKIHPYDCITYIYSKESFSQQKEVLSSTGVTEILAPKIYSIYMEQQSFDKNNFSFRILKNFPFKEIFPGMEFNYGSYNFKAFDLKGHTLGQMGLIENNKKILFSADQLIHNITPIVATSYPDQHLLKYFFKSQDYILKYLSDYTVIPSHGDILTDPSNDIRRSEIAYINKLNHTLRIFKNNYSRYMMSQSRSLLPYNTVREIMETLYGLKDPNSAKEFSKYKMCLTKTFSLLEYLSDLGLLSRSLEHGTFLWTLKEA